MFYLNKQKIILKLKIKKYFCLVSLHIIFVFDYLKAKLYFKIVIPYFVFIVFFKVFRVRFSGKH